MGVNISEQFHKSKNHENIESTDKNSSSQTNNAYTYELNTWVGVSSNKGRSLNESELVKFDSRKVEAQK